MTTDRPDPAPGSDGTAPPGAPDEPPPAAEPGSAPGPAFGPAAASEHGPAGTTHGPAPSTDPAPGGTPGSAPGTAAGLDSTDSAPGGALGPDGTASFGEPDPPSAAAGGRGLLDGEPVVATAGIDVLDDALRAQAVRTVRVDWRPPVPGTGGDIAAVLADPRHHAANATAVERLTGARPFLADVRPARDVLGLEPGTFLHAGPPITWERASGPMRGALIGAALFEGLAATPEDAEALFAAGRADLRPCHSYGAVGPMAGVVSPSMWMLCVEETAYGGRSYCSLNEGLGKVLRYGAYAPEVIDRLRWMAGVLGPVLATAVRAHGPLDLRALIAQALQMGDELHNRNRAATSMVIRDLAADIVAAADARDAAEILRFISGNEHFFLNFGMAAAKASGDAARNVPGSSLVVAMARNGTDFGVQCAGTGDRWFTGPSGVPDGLYLGAYGPDDANPDIGDSTIMETAGVGGFAMAAAPAIVRFVGGEVPDALAATARMYEITMAEHPAYAVPILDFRGTPVGVDVTRIARTGVLPVVNTGIAGRVAGTGQVGAGLVTPPMEAFTGALHALAETAQPPE